MKNLALPFDQKDKNKVFINFHYESKFPSWNKFASVRSRPRRIAIEDQENDYFYPIDRTAIYGHPLIQNLTEVQKKYILLQNAYKFMSDIAFVELELINRVAYKLYNGRSRYILPSALRFDLLSIIVDESYHAFVALDFMDQLQAVTGIAPLHLSQEVELGVSMQKFSTDVAQEYSDIFEIIAICIGENTLTKELFNLTRDTKLNRVFHDVMADHMIDEGRHSNIFSRILQEIWKEIDEHLRLQLGKMLPAFLVDYLKPDLHIEFDKKLLCEVGFQPQEIQQIITDSYPEHNATNLKMKNPIYANILAVLTRAKILDHAPTQKEFVTMGLI